MNCQIKEMVKLGLKDPQLWFAYHQLPTKRFSVNCGEIFFYIADPDSLNFYLTPNLLHILRLQVLPNFIKA